MKESLKVSKKQALLIHMQQLWLPLNFLLNLMGRVLNYLIVLYVSLMFLGHDNALKKLFQRLLTYYTGRKIQTQGDGTQRRRYIYVDDAVNAIDIIFNKGKAKMMYNIGTENEFNVLDMGNNPLKMSQLDKK